MRILVAPDKFKGSLSAHEAAVAIRAGILDEIPTAHIECVPLADGGEGTSAAFLDVFGGEWISCETHDAIGRPCTARYAWLPNEVAVIEMAAASGLAPIDPSSRNPLRTSTFGTGEMLLDAARRGAQRIIIGLGGSATNDAGAGFAAALGFRFLAVDGATIDPVPSEMPRLVRIERPNNLALPEILALSDVRSPLLGERGASRTFGPQKGADPHQVEELERTLTSFAALVVSELGSDFRETPGGGAAGGLGFGLLSFCGATIEPGFDAFARFSDLESHVAASDVVFTGEGGLDATTAEGKGPGGLARIARQHGKLVIAFAGTIDDEDVLNRHFDLCFGLANRPMTAEYSSANAGPLLRAAAGRVARLLNLSMKL